MSRRASPFEVSERTARKWLARYRKGGAAALENRSSRPLLAPNRTLAPWNDLMEKLRREYQLTAGEIARKLNFARSTVADWLKRRGLGRLKSMDAPASVRRYQRQWPGGLLHLDVRNLARLATESQAIARPERGRRSRLRPVAIEDAIGLAYVEMLPDERCSSTTGFRVRALRWFKARGIRIERVPTDKGSGYFAKLFRKALRMLSIRHIRTRPYTPKNYGRAERFIQTVLRNGPTPSPYSHPKPSSRPSAMARLV